MIIALHVFSSPSQQKAFAWLVFLLVLLAICDHPQNMIYGILPPFI
jgi:hypothetical protein